MSLDRIAVTWIGLLCLLFGQEWAIAAEPAVRVEGVPDRLVLPPEEGVNRIVTATIKGATAKSVLAKTQDSRLRLHLNEVAPDQFQVNLADPDVVAVLEASSGRKAFRVFAETADGKVLSSVVINYTTRQPATRSADKPRYYLISTDDGDEAREVETLGKRSWHMPKTWIDPQRVASIEARFDASDAVREARATIGQKSWKFSADGQVARLKLTKDLRSAWREEGALWLSHRDDEWQRAAVLLVRPDRLDFGRGNVVSVVVYQRETKEVPGSNDYLTVQLGDITHGQVHVSLLATDGKPLLDRVSLRRGDRRTFTFGGAQYVLTVREMVNLLIGDDWAEVEVSRLAASEQARIDALLRHVEESKLTFIREGKEYTATEAAKHLREKYAVAGPQVDTLEEFIDKIASRSSLTGKPYLVKLPDSTTVETSKWLREAASTLKESP